MPPIDSDALGRSIAHRGEASNLSPLFAKLQSRKPIVLGVLGASVAQNAGCLDQPHRRCMHYNGQHPIQMAWGAPRKRPFKGFAVRFLEHINATYPHHDHRINNSGVDKTPVSGMLTCLMTNLPTTLDIVLIEFNSMARWTKQPGVEALVRQLLASLKPRPAIAIVSVNSWCRATFVRKVEDEAERVCKHYGISCLSQRRALEPLVAAGTLTKEQLVGKDCIHPIHGSLGVESVTLILQHWFDRMRLRFLSSTPSGLNGGAAEPLPLPAPLWPENDDSNRGTWGQQCFAFGAANQVWHYRLTQQLTPVRWRTTWCPPSERPWLPNTPSARQQWPGACRAAPIHEPDALSCPDKVVRTGGSKLAAFLAQPPRGFFYCLMELKTNGQGTSKESFGVLAIVPGATLHFDARASPPFLAQLAYLTSYRGMGTAAVNCVGACECPEQIIDAHDAGVNATVFATLALHVSSRPGAASIGDEQTCGMQLHVLNRTSSGGHKFKVRHLMLAKREVGASRRLLY